MKKSLVALVLRVGSLNMQNGKLNLPSIVKIGVFWTTPWPAMVHMKLMVDFQWLIGNSSATWVCIRGIFTYVAGVWYSIPRWVAVRPLLVPPARLGVEGSGVGNVSGRFEALLAEIAGGEKRIMWSRRQKETQRHGIRVCKLRNLQSKYATMQ